jgi:hypothetical protein
MFVEAVEEHVEAAEEADEEADGVEVAAADLLSTSRATRGSRRIKTLFPLRQTATISTC